MSDPAKSARRLRILQVGKFFPPPFGGMETVLFNLVRELAAVADVDVVVANTRNRTERAELGGARILKLRSWGAFFGTSLCPTMPFMLRRLMKRNRYDVVELHLPNPTGHLALLWALPRGTRLVVHWHSDIVRQKSLLRLYAPFVKRLLDRADAIAAATPRNLPSSTQVDRVRYGRKWVTLPFGLDIDAFAETPAVRSRAEAIRRQHGADLILACGRHIYYKGFDHLIRAIARMPKGKLLLIGKGPLTEELIETARNAGCADRVVFLGTVRQADMPAYFHAAELICMPSVDPSEAFGMVQLEAMACRKPVVCCELGNGVTYVNRHGETGLVVPPRDPDALANAILGLLDDPAARYRMGSAGYERVSRLYSLDAMRREHARVFGELAGLPPEDAGDGRRGIASGSVTGPVLGGALG